jgi:hypothetical protein
VLSKTASPSSPDTFQLTVTLAERKFAECLSLTSVKAKFTSLKDAREMFYNCSALTESDCEWTDNLSVTSGMFYNCTGLT